MLGKLNSALHEITPYMSDAINEVMRGAMAKVGLTSVIVGGAKTISDKAQETSGPALQILDLSVALISMGGGIMFIVGIIFNIILKRRKDKREQELHDKEMQE